MTQDNHIQTILENTHDTQFGLTAPEMGIQTTWSFTENTLDITMKAGFPTGLLEKSLKPALLQALQKSLPDYKTQIHLQNQIRSHVTQMPGKGLKGVKNVIAIASGKGGVGKSTMTVNLAIALARMGARVGILDADIYGPSIPLMLGETSPVQVQDDKYLPVHAHGIQAMSIGYLADANQALIWRGPMLAKSLLQMLDITLWDNLDYLFIDLPPGTGDIQLSLAQKIPLTSAIVVTTPQQVATADAQKALTLFAKTGIHVTGVIENMALHTCSQCNHQEPIFGSGGAKSLCLDNDCNLLGQLPLDMRICKNSDTGLPTSLADNSLADTFMKIGMFATLLIAQLPLNYANRFPDIQIANPR